MLFPKKYTLSKKKKKLVLRVTKDFIVIPSKLSNYSEVNGKENSATSTFLT